MIKSEHPLYMTWKHMRGRCRRPSHVDFKDYGARGITVCDRWFGSFFLFTMDMGPRPTPKHTIDRIDNTRGYQPNNCRWSTPKEQQRNRSNNRKILHDGETLPLSVWAERAGLSDDTLRRRILRGWPWAAHGLLMPRGVCTWTRRLPDPGWVCEVSQAAYGHRAPKLTWLYYVGERKPSPLRWSHPPCVMTTTTSRRRKAGVEMTSHKERSATPPAFRDVLLSLARGAAGSGAP